MRHLRTLALGVALAAVPLLARAQDGALPATAAASAVSAPVSAPVDPTRLAAARRTIDFVFPTGTYARIMAKSMDAMMGPMMDGVGAMPISTLAGIGGVKPDDVAKLGKGTLAELMGILDPAYRQRMELSTRAMMTEFTSVMALVEPGMREGLSHAYARRFDIDQLGELNRFFATPTGRAYAKESMTIMSDPEVIAQMQAFVPVLLKRMPEVMTRAQAATAGLPKPRKYEDLTPAEQQRFRRLLGQDAVPGKGSPTP